ALPTGTTVYGGLPLAGPGYDMVFFYSLNTSVTSVSQMTVGTIIPFRTAAVATAAPAGGIIPVGAFQVPGTTGGTPIAFAIGAFCTEGGTITTWADAIAAFNLGLPSLVGSGTIVSDVILGGQDSDGNPRAEPDILHGWTSFSLVGTPEPSTGLLVALGG